MLSYYPAIQQSLEMMYQEITKPRADLVSLLGEDNQNCPTLLLAEDSPKFEKCGIMARDGLCFINNARDIGRYWALRYGTPVPRGTGPI